MIAAAFRALGKWLRASAWPAATVLALRWWRDFERVPELHALSMIAGVAVLVAMKILARLIA